MSIKIACNIIIYSRGGVLLGKRKSGVFYGAWCLPGGHINFKESIHKCAKRELFEETGLAYIPLNLFFIIEEIKKTEHYYHFFFYAVLKKNRLMVKNIEIGKFKEWRYFKINNLPKDTIPPHRHAISNFIKVYRKSRGFEGLKNKIIFSGTNY